MLELNKVQLILIGASLAACAPENKPSVVSNGVLGQDASGQIRVLSPEEEKDFCAKNFCEPNYIWKASVENPNELVIEGVTKAKPKPKPKPSKEIDYSKTIIRAPEAWKTTLGSKDVVVAVIDTGVDYTHPDLKDNIWVNEKELNGKPGVDDDGDGFIDDVYGWDFANNKPNAMDDNEHGTHCAGIIGATLNGKGMVGVTQKVRIMPVKFLSATGSGDTASAIKAIDYAVAHGAKVLSNSWGGGASSELLKQAIQRAQAKGVIVIAAAGNETNDNDAYPSFPASYPGVIAVASTDSKDMLSYFSNYGKSSVLLAAPGSDIYSTVPGGGYAKLSGTSMAAPQVSGAVALALSVSPQLNGAQMAKALCDSSKKILLSSTHCGRLDVAQLVNAVK